MRKQHQHERRAHSFGDFREGRAPSSTELHRAQGRSPIQPVYFASFGRCALRLQGLLLQIFFICLLLVGLGACKKPKKEEKAKPQEKVLQIGIRAKIGSLDPVRSGSTQYGSFVTSATYETLLQYGYLKRPLALEPLLLKAMPQVSEENTVYTFELKKGVLFQDDPCFKDGKGRELVASDVIYSIKRMANADFKPKGWWIYNGRIKGFDDYRKQQKERPEGTPFDYDAKVEGLELTGSHTFKIHLTDRFPQFLYTLAMVFTAVLPKEAVDHYGPEFGRHAVGSGAFRLKKWTPGVELVWEKNPNYRHEVYPSEASAAAQKRGLLAPAGKKIPFLDGVVMNVYEEDQPMWLKWDRGDLDFIQTPSEYFPLAFDKDWKLKEKFKKRGVGSYNYKVIDLVYIGFNMDDPVVGGEKGKLLRQALSSALDMQEVSDTFYNNAITIYDGPIPPGLDGHKEGTISPYRGKNLEKAKALLAQAGYPGGKGLPKLHLHTPKGSNALGQIELHQRQLKAIGVQLEGQIHSFPELDARVKKRQAQIFRWAWMSDYPDAENNLALFYGPNETPGVNHFNYKNPAYDQLYQQIRTMPASPERTKIYEQMRDIIIEDCPMMGGMARTRFYVWHEVVHNALPDETWHGWIKYLDVDAR